MQSSINPAGFRVPAAYFDANAVKSRPPAQLDPVDTIQQIVKSSIVQIPRIDAIPIAAIEFGENSPPQEYGWDPQVNNAKHLIPSVKNWVAWRDFIDPFNMITNSTYRKKIFRVNCARPLNRAWFKMMEMMARFEISPLENATRSPPTPLYPGHGTTVMLCEGPGGFAQAFGEFYQKAEPIIGISLVSDTKNLNLIDNVVPGKKGRFEIYYGEGEDADGDLYSLKTQTELVNHVGEEGATLVTGDGGVDASESYDDQEYLNTRLFLAELCASVQLLAPGGNMLLKKYSHYTRPMIDLMTIISYMFESTYLFKPYTSRPTNDEEYVIGTGFIDADRENVVKILTTVMKMYSLKKYQGMCLTRILKTTVAPCVKALEVRSQTRNSVLVNCITSIYSQFQLTQQPPITDKHVMLWISTNGVANRWLTSHNIPERILTMNTEELHREVIIDVLQKNTVADKIPDDYGRYPGGGIRPGSLWETQKKRK